MERFLLRDHIRKMLKDAGCSRANCPMLETGDDIEDLKSTMLRSTTSKPCPKQCDRPLPKTELDGNTPLHLAVEEKDEELIEALVLGGADVNAQNKKRETPLYRAAKGKDNQLCWRIMKFLIEQGADVYGSDYINKTFLHIFLREDPPLTPSHFHEITSYLIEKGHAKLFNMTSFLTVTPLQFAVYRLEVDHATLDLLQENGVNFNAADELGRSVLFWAVNGKRSPAFLSKLIQLGADWKHRNYVKRSLLHQAANWGHLEGLQFFLGKGLDINAVDIDGSTPLHYVMIRGRINAFEMAKFLVESGANVKIRDKLGRTPLDVVLSSTDFRNKDGVIKLLEDLECNETNMTGLSTSK